MGVVGGAGGADPTARTADGGAGVATPAEPGGETGHGDAEGSAAATSGLRVPYTVDLRLTEAAGEPAAGEAREANALRPRLEQASSLRALSGEPPATRLGLRRRLEADLEAFRTVLRSEGFYAGDVSGEIAGQTAPTQVSVRVSPGPLYTVAATQVVYRDADPAAGSLPSALDGVGLAVGEPARADAVLTAERDLVDRLQGIGYPFARAVDRRVVVNHARRAMTVRIDVEAGPRATFGAVRYEGLERVARDYLDDQVPWTVGDTFDRRALDRFRNRILDTRLFREVTVRPAETPERTGRLPVDVVVTEAPPRSVGGGVRYSTDDGPGVRAFWEHRNLFGRGEHLRANVDASPISQSAEITFDKPRFLHPDQSLRLSATGERSDRDAYSGLTARLAGGVDRRLDDVWRVSAGASLDLARLDDHGETEDSLLIGLPLGVSRDDTDDALNPTAGSRLALTLTPYAGQSDDVALGFAVADLTGSAYWAPLDSDRVVLAARGRLASLMGADTGGVPAHRRLYAGGGGSVRGYGHQMVGPLDDDGDPLGGRSALELGLEARLKVTESIGVVPFLDAGLVSDAPMPDPGDSIRWAAGLGGRYYTDFGPLRVDIGVPLNPRDADDWFQVYISLGQAF